MSFLRKRMLSKKDLQAISASIARAEQKTCGEIRVVLRHSRHAKEAGLSLHELALREFYHLGMEKTRERTGVLILILFAERRFQILGDEGIHRKLGDQTWDQLAGAMSVRFKEGKYRDGILEAVGNVGEILARHFPRRATDNPNELSDEVVEE